MKTMYQMREALKKVYDGDKWQKKVKLMPDNQVLAIYLDFVKKGMIR